MCSRWALAVFFLIPFWAAAAPADEAQEATAEVKISIDPADIGQGLKRLRFDLEGGKGVEREIFFYDTPDLRLSRAGVILRARKDKKGGGHDDVTAKVRPALPGKIAPPWSKNPGFKCEVDAISGQEMPTCSLKAEASGDAIDGVFIGTKGVESLLSRDQRGFLEDRSGLRIPWEDLVPLGPIWSFSRELKEGDDSFDAELWVLSGRNRFLELSSRTQVSRIPEVQARLSSLVKGLGLRESRAEKSKTAFAMEFYAPR